MKNVILLVDDNIEVQNLFVDLLVDTSLKVLTFSSVKEAQIYLIKPENRSEVCAIVSDLMMGPIDGLEFLSYIKKNPDTAGIDFFLFTGADVSVFKTFTSSFTLKGIIEKPFNRQVFLNTFKNLALDNMDKKIAVQ